MKRIDLPFYPIFVCEICGAHSRSWESAKECERIPIQKPDLKIGDKVKLRREEYTIYEFHYSRPGDVMPNIWDGEYMHTHTLWVCIRQHHFFTEEGVSKKRAWEPNDAGYLELRIAYDDLTKGLLDRYVGPWS